MILSGGSGSRVGGDTPKQYVQVNGRMIVSYTMETLAKCDFVGMVLVAAEEWRDCLTDAWNSLGAKDINFAFADPGASRQCSIYNGLIQLSKMGALPTDVVLIQDAARPNTKPELIKALLCPFDDDTQGDVEAIVPVLPMKDTVYLSQDGVWLTERLDRSKVFAGQAPEAFLFGLYQKATEDLMPNRILEINGSAEPALIAGMRIHTIPGDESNYKITTKEDLERWKYEIEGIRS